MLIASQQTWPSNFWLNHPRVLIFSATVIGIFGLDALAAASIRIYQRICKKTSSFPIPSAEEIQAIQNRLQDWKAKCPQTRDDLTHLCTAFAKTDININTFDLIIMRGASRSCPGCFGADGMASGFHLNSENNNNKYLGQYQRILFVTYSILEGPDKSPPEGLKFWEEELSNNPYGQNSEMKQYLQKKALHIHLKPTDAKELMKQQKLATYLIETIKAKVW